MTSTLAVLPIRRPPFSRRRYSRFVIAAALFAAVLIANAVLVVLAAASIDITSLYIVTT